MNVKKEILKFLSRNILKHNNNLVMMMLYDRSLFQPVKRRGICSTWYRLGRIF